MDGDSTVKTHLKHELWITSLLNENILSGYSETPIGPVWVQSYGTRGMIIQYDGYGSRMSTSRTMIVLRYTLW